MADFRKLGKGVSGALEQAKQLAAAEREANLKKFLEPSKAPMRLYHGTTATEGGKGLEAVRRLKPSKEGALGSGVYLTPSTAHASGYSGIPNDEAIAAMAGDPYAKKMADQFMADRASGTVREGQAGGNMLPVYAQITNPLIIEGKGDPMVEALIKLGMDEEKAARMVERAYENKGYIGKEVETRARAAGYDGLMQYRDGDLSEVVSYNPNAVKSAIGNQGTYDTTSPDLSKAHGGQVRMAGGGKALKGALSAVKKASAEAATLSKVKGTQDLLPAAERNANLQKFLSKSQVTDPVFHAAKTEVKAFSPKHRTELSSMGHHFGTSDQANFRTGQYDFESKTPNIGKYHLNIENPLEVSHMASYAPDHLAEELMDMNLLMPEKYDALTEKHNYDSVSIGDELVKILKKSGYDGLKYPNEKEGEGFSYVPFSPTQIKSAIGNRGTYDIEDVDVNKAQGGVIHMQKGGKSGALGKIAQAIQAADKEANAAVKAGKLEEALRAKQAPMTTPQGTGLPLMPRSQGMYTPGVEQKDLPRMPTVDKARAAGKQPKYNERMQDLLDSPTARKKVDKLIDQGAGLGVKEWYGTEPIRQVAMDIGMTQKQFEEFMAQMASASQRNPVDQQNKMGSYLYYLSQTGQLPDDAFLMTNKIKRGKAERPEGTAIELPPGYGSLAQGDIFSRGKQIASGDIEGALPPDKKLGTFYRNYLGNLKPVTVDVNAVRGPIIERGDPRWLASKLVEKDEEGNVIATHFPRSDVESGKLSLKDAKARPGFWEAAPSGSEYAGFEELWQRGAKRKGMEPAEAQALGWYGSADVTALKTKPELYVENLERMIRRTAEQTGQNPRLVMEDVLRGKQYLKAKGGSVDKQPVRKIKAYGKDIEAKIHDEFASHINAARGGEIKKMTFRNTPPLKKAQGGPVANPSLENMVPDSSDSGKMKYAQQYAGGGMAEQIPGQSVSAPPADQKSYTRHMMEILGRMAKDQGREEVSSLRKPRAATDLLNRGVIAPAAGLPVDMINMGLEGIDAVRDLASGKRVDNRFASEKPFLGSEHLKDVMSQYDMTSDQERPMMETGLSLFSPAGAVKGASKAAQMAAQAKRPANPFMRRPSNLIKQPG